MTEGCGLVIGDGLRAARPRKQELGVPLGGSGGLGAWHVAPAVSFMPALRRLLVESGDADRLLVVGRQAGQAGEV